MARCLQRPLAGLLPCDVKNERPPDLPLPVSRAVAPCAPCTHLAGCAQQSDPTVLCTAGDGGVMAAAVFLPVPPCLASPLAGCAGRSWG